MKKLLATVALIAGLASPSYAYDFLFNGVSGTAISATYFVSATNTIMVPSTVTPSTALPTGSLAVTNSGTLAYLSATTWLEVGQKGTTAKFVPAQ